VDEHAVDDGSTGWFLKFFDVPSIAWSDHALSPILVESAIPA
jgi:hypothetical protein